MKRFLKMIPITIAAAFMLQIGLMALPASSSHFSLVNVAHAVDSESKQGVCEGIGLIDGNNTCDDKGGSEKAVGGVLQTAINLFSMVVGVISVIMIIVGGLKYIISMGDGSNVKSAKDTILYAIIGLVIVAMAQIIVRFVLTSI